MPRPTKITTEVAARAARFDPSITPARVQGWVEKPRGYILRPTEPIEDGYFRCLLALSELTGTAGSGKSIGVVTRLARQGFLPYIPADRPREDLSAFIAVLHRKATRHETGQAERAAYVRAVREWDRLTNPTPTQTTETGDVQ
jgi:hypothetical protein